MDKKVTGIIAYLTIIGWLVAYLAGEKEEAKFHMNQALVIDLAFIVVSVLAYIPIIRIVVGLLDFVLFIFMVLGIVYAASDKENELPLIGSIKLLK